jgi:hypothetical protein
MREAAACCLCIRRKTREMKKKEDGRQGKLLNSHKLKKMKKESKRSKTTAPGLRAWSPTALLSGPERA